MRSRCRSLLFALSLLAAANAVLLGIAPRWALLPMAPVQAKGALDSATASDGETADLPSGAGASKCAPGDKTDKNDKGNAAAAHARRFHGGYGGEGGIGHMPLDFSSLNLSEEQKKQDQVHSGT